MDALLRNEQRLRQWRDGPDASAGTSSEGLYPRIAPLGASARPSGVARQGQSDDIVDLTKDDDRPLPSSQYGRTPQSKANSSVRMATNTTNPAQSWQLPARSKHAAPSKIRMIDISASPTKPTTGPVFGTPSQPHQRPHPFQDALKQTMKDGVQAFKHVWKDGVARLEQAVDEANGPRPGVGPMHGHNGSNGGRPFIVDDADEDRPPPDTFGGAILTAEEREQQLQDMLNSMVLPPELGDIDLEKASKVEGLKCKLLPHQVAGYLWLKGREGGRHKGGILADDMGVGKTVQMLALIVGNAPHVTDTTIDKIRHEPEQRKKSKKKVIVDETDEDAAPKMEKIELKSKATLIVAPLAVIRQWEREIKEKTCAGLKVTVHHGPSRVKDAARFAKFDIVITTYSTVASEWNNATGAEKSPKKKPTARAKQSRTNAVVIDSSEDDVDTTRGHGLDSSDDSDDSFVKPVKQQRKPPPPAPLFDVDWMRVVLDEAQNIKNHRTKASMACAALSRRTLSKWCLSGTPIQNEALEMFSLIRFLAIPPFDEYAHFREKISDPLKSSNQNRVNWGMKRLCAVLTTIMLRRTKDTVHDGKPIILLPNRHVNILSSDFDDHKERAFYKDLEEQVKRNFEDAEESGRKVNHMVSLLMLLRLRQACSHPALVSRNVRIDAGAANGSTSGAKQDGQTSTAADGDDDDDDGLTELLAGMSVATKRCERCQIDLDREQAASGATQCQQCTAKMLREENRGWEGKSSTKIRSLLRILDRVRSTSKDEKTIVFSQFTSFLDLVQPFLDQQGHRYVRYDGSMRPDERERALDSVRSDPSVRLILISFKAGNVGLNLTCCSHVVLMDLWWNPMLEAQSIDRAHRLGQQRDVHVYKLVIKDSVEERILALQDKKRALAEAALEGSKLSKANKLDRKELMYLFSGGPVA